MPENLTPDERLLLPILRAADLAEEDHEPTSHPDDESLALFAEGALDGHERDELVRHLDLCVTCRRTTSLLMSMSREDDVSAESRRPRTLATPPTPEVSRNPLQPELLRVRLRSAAVYVLAASLLIAVGLFFGVQRLDPRMAERRVYSEANELLAAKQFTKARDLLADAESRGTTSDRLRSLQSQAVRELPGPVALAFAGRLGDFGYEPGGIVAREAAEGKLGLGLKPAYELLQDAGADEVETILNRGHALLALRRPREALDEFQRSAELGPNDPLVWLGHGLADFMLDNFAAAEHDFREALRLDGKNMAARINLALALEELGRHDEARATWREVLAVATEDADRQLAERAIGQLEAAQ